MENEELSFRDLIRDSHIELDRQGPGSPEMTVKALSFLDDPHSLSRIADLGCGTGGQTMIIAQNTSGTITGVDFFPEFIDQFNSSAKELNLQDRVKGIVCSMDDLPFQENEFDLIWSEGAIDSIGFEKGLSYWNAFLKKTGSHLLKLDVGRHL